MEPRSFVINEWSRLRSGWRIAVFVGLYIALLLLLGAVLLVVYAIAINSRFGFSVGPYVENVLFRFMLLIAAVLAGYVCTRALEGLPWRALGLSFHQNWLLHFGIGWVVCADALVLAVRMRDAGRRLSF